MSQGIVVGHEGPGGGAAGYGLHHGRFHFQKVAADEKLAHGLNDPAAQDEDLLHPVVDDQVQVALAVAGFHVGQAVPFLRQGPQALGQQPEFIGQQREFAGLGPEQGPLQADVVPQVHELEDLELAVPHPVLADVSLQAPAAVREMHESGLAEIAPGNDPAGHPAPARFALQRFGVHGTAGLLRLGGRRVHREAGRIQADAQGDQALGLAHPVFLHRACLVRHCSGSSVSGFQAPPKALSRPGAVRFASQSHADSEPLRPAGLRQCQTETII